MKFPFHTTKSHSNGSPFHPAGAAGPDTPSDPSDDSV